MSLIKSARGLPKFMADCGFWRHPSWVGSGLAAIGLQACGISYCYEHETDGWLPGPTHIELAEALGLSAKDVKTSLTRLLERGRWVVEDGRFHIAGFEDEHPSSGDIRASRQQRSDAGKKGASARWSHSESHDESDAVRMGDRNSREEESREAKTQPFESDFDEVWSGYPRKEAKLSAFKAYQARRRERVSPEELAKAVLNFATAMASRDREHILQGSTFFGPNERWKDYLEPVSLNGSVAPGDLGW